MVLGTGRGAWFVIEWCGGIWRGERALSPAGMSATRGTSREMRAADRGHARVSGTTLASKQAKVVARSEVMPPADESWKTRKGKRRWE
jgi:hypothetical protein